MSPSSRLTEHRSHDRSHAIPSSLLGREPASASRRYRVKPRLAVALGHAPRAAQQASLFEPHPVLPFQATARPRVRSARRGCAWVGKVQAAEATHCSSARRDAKATQALHPRSYRTRSECESVDLDTSDQRPTAIATHDEGCRYRAETGHRTSCPPCSAFWATRPMWARATVLVLSGQPKLLSRVEAVTSIRRCGESLNRRCDRAGHTPRPENPRRCRAQVQES